MIDRKFEQYFALFLILVGVGLRLLPHPANFTPLTALALLAGATLPVGVAISVPLIAIIASDLVLGTHGLFWLVWVSFALTVLIGFRVARSGKPAPLLVGTVAGSLLFFVATNLGVFFFENMYPHTWEGLQSCFFLALPFFRNSLLGDLFYSGAFFGIFYLAKNGLFSAKPLSKV